MIKKIPAILTAIIIALSMTVITVSAAGSISLVQTSSASIGETFTVDLVLSGNPGFTALGINVIYSSSELEFVEVSDSKLLDGFYKSPAPGHVGLYWSTSDDSEENGTLATITFRALTEDAQGSMISASVTATQSNGVRATVDGGTTVVTFSLDGNLTVSDSNDDQTSNPEDQEIIEDEEVVEEDNDDEYTEEVTTPPATTPAPTTTKVTTTRRHHSTTTPEPETAPPTTTPPPTTTDPTTTSLPETTPPTTTSTTALDPSITPTTTTTQPTTITTNITEAFKDIYKDGIDNKVANRGTLLIAMIAIALTVVVVISVEAYKRNR